MPEASSPTFTIFIPSYNRATLLPRAFASIERQTSRDFEVLIIDDGSTDNTQDIVAEWSESVDFPVHYHWQENQGKPATHNFALQFANGFFTVILDSDDTLADNALALLLSQWESIPDEQKMHFAGVEGHCALLSNGQISGDNFPADIFDSNYLETRYHLHIAGDKKNAMRTEVLKAFPFPIFPGEKSIRESVVWNRIATKYKMRYINQVIQYIEYQPDGLSTGIFQRRVNNPQGFRFAYQEMLNDFSHYYSSSEQMKEMAKYIRFSFHCRIPMTQQRLEINNKALWLLMLCKGWINYRLDLAKIKKNQKKARHA